MKKTIIILTCLLVQMFILTVSNVSSQYIDSSKVSSDSIPVFDFNYYDKYKTTSLSDTAAIDLALKYLDERKNEWKSDDIVLRHWMVSSGGCKAGRFKDVRFRQYYKGVLVFGGTVYVDVFESGELRDILYALKDNIDLDVIPEISAEKALDSIFAGEPNIKKETIKSYICDLVVIKSIQDGSTGLCWHFYISSTTENLFWSCFVNAKTGRVGSIVEMWDI
ncbi:MAG: hypothetical protein KAR42_15970 [candidate division Zixibacteria bacterium]|nr:hypothetical protein [candidate division Zixibacteria bacterium]